MKSLNIKADVCTLSISNYGDSVYINGEELQKIIKDHLPKDLVAYENYPAKISVSIEFFKKDIDIAHPGYSLPDENESQQTENTVTEEDDTNA